MFIDNTPSKGFAGQINHPYGAINDNGTINLSLLFHQAHAYARNLVKNVRRITYREAFAEGLRRRRWDIRERLRLVAERAYQAAEIAKGGAAKRRVELSLLIDMEAHQKRPNHEKLNAAYRELASLGAVAA
jgi:hypothetical protein